jgi:hypothetical protein
MNEGADRVIGPKLVADDYVKISLHRNVKISLGILRDS